MDEKVSYVLTLLSAHDSKQHCKYRASNVCSSLRIEGIGPVNLRRVSNNEVIKGISNNEVAR